MNKETKNIVTTELFEDWMPVGVSAKCPFCTTVNIAYYGALGIIWNPELGVRCEHYTGYHKDGKLPTFIFE